MQTTTLSFANMHTHGELMANLIRARRQSFTLQNRRELPEAIGGDYDQYDTPASRWIAVHQGERILAGIRLTPTTARCGIYSYTIRDAQKGLLEAIPSDLLSFSAPVDPNVWESSGVFVAHDTPLAIRQRVHGQLIAEMTAAARQLGAKRVLGIIPASWPNWAARCGLDIQAAGRMLEFDDHVSQCVSISLAETLH